MWLCEQCTVLPKNPSQSVLEISGEVMNSQYFLTLQCQLGDLSTLPVTFIILSLHWNEIHNYLAADNYRGVLCRGGWSDSTRFIISLLVIIGGYFWKGIKKHPYNYPCRSKYIIYSLEFNWIFSENAKFFSEAPPPTPYPITNTSLHDINIDN